jgi:hypothetical protein
VKVATMHVQHRWDVRETTTIHEAITARATADAQADAAVEAARARAAQAQAEDAARWAHWVNALAEGHARRAACGGGGSPPEGGAVGGVKILRSEVQE